MQACCEEMKGHQNESPACQRGINTCQTNATASSRGVKIENITG